MLARSHLRRAIVNTTQRGHFSISRMSNGLKVISSNDGTGISGIGVFSLNATKFENAHTAGAAAILEGLPLRGNEVHDMEQVGKILGTFGNAFKITNNKEAMGTLVFTPRYHVREGLQLLNGMCLQPTKSEAIFNEVKEMTRERSLTATRDATKVCFDLIHKAAWGGKGLGNESLPTEAELDALTLENFHLFHSTFTQPERTVVAGTGIADHAAFALQCEEELKFPEKPRNADHITAQVDQPYCGGTVLRHNSKAPESTKKFAERNLTHIGLMFQGVPISHPNYYPISLIQSLLGGGTSFSSGGPGKGMQTKLFREVLHREGWIHGIECISAWYSDGGMIGLYASAPHEWAKHLRHVCLYQLASIPDRIDAAQLEVAKNQLCSQLVLLGEGREQLLSDTGFNMVIHDYVVLEDEVVKGTELVKLDDIRRVCDEMVQKPITFALYGDTTGVPEHQVLEQQVRALHAKFSAGYR